MKLAERHCINGAKRLSEDHVTALATEIDPEWKTEMDSRISRTLTFADFAGALDFVNAVGRIAESENHHPDLQLSWGRVRVDLTTHDAGGLTENDFILAAKIDQLKGTD